LLFDIVRNCFEVIKANLDIIVFKVEHQVGKFVKEHKPEIIEPIIS